MNRLPSVAAYSSVRRLVAFVLVMGCSVERSDAEATALPNADASMSDSGLSNDREIVSATDVFGDGTGSSADADISLTVDDAGATVPEDSTGTDGLPDDTIETTDDTTDGSQFDALSNDLPWTDDDADDAPFDDDAEDVAAIANDGESDSDVGAPDAWTSDSSDADAGAVMSCNNGSKEGSESDIDCGGSCSPCTSGLKCVSWSDCQSESCVAGYCAVGATTCTNGIQDGDETDVDCGGSCTPCVAGKACNGWADCVSMSCTAGVCQGGDDVSSCTNGEKDGLESDVDCGGGKCVKCENLRTCGVPSDCFSNLCGDDHKCHGATCYNSKHDGNESGPDCGGECEPCPLWSDCFSDADCQTDLTCSTISGLCIHVCSDGKLGDGEADIDCGGKCPYRCNTGESCSTSNDCYSLLCSGGACSPSSAHCTNGILDYGETSETSQDGECGGSECKACGFGLACNSDIDCLSMICTAGKCGSPISCENGVKNYHESDKDCGGQMCAPCPVGAGCSAPSDCVVSNCIDSKCKEPSCSDKVKNGDETDVDCGGPDCTACADSKKCATDSDCMGGACTWYRCGRCDDGLHNGGESDIDCGGGCMDCPKGAKCKYSGDCDDEECEGFVCGGCSDGIKGSKEGGIDCGGPCPKCVVGSTCGDDDDCEADLTCDFTSKVCCVTNKCGKCGDVPPETCNGVDDDCNGVTDDLSGPAPCPNQQGVCTGSTGKCSSGKVTCNYSGIVGYSSIETVCDKLDNDCDGKVDEGGCSACAQQPAESYPLGAVTVSSVNMSRQPFVLDLKYPYVGSGLYLHTSGPSGTVGRMISESGAMELSDSITGPVSSSRDGSYVSLIGYDIISFSNVAMLQKVDSDVVGYVLATNLSIPVPAEAITQPIPLDVRSGRVAVLVPSLSGNSFTTVAKVFSTTFPNSEQQSSQVSLGFNGRSRVVLETGGVAHAFISSTDGKVLTHRIVGQATATTVAATWSGELSAVATKSGWLHVAYVAPQVPILRVATRSPDGQWLPYKALADDTVSTATDLVEDPSGAVVAGWFDTTGAVHIGRLGPDGQVEDMGSRWMSSIPGYIPSRLMIGAESQTGQRVVAAAMMDETLDVGLSTLVFCRGYADECIPDCDNRNCGGNGCGGSCGTCSESEACSSTGACIDVVSPAGCLPTGSPCDPTSNSGCDGAAGFACDVISSKFQCFGPPNEVPIGGACSSSAFCVATSTCVSGTCRRYCCDKSDCPTGSCIPFFASMGIGYCAP